MTSWIKASRPSPAMVVAVLALVAALAGTAVAGPDASSSAINKKKVKKIATKQAAKQIDAQLPWRTEDIADGAVTGAKLADGAVTGAKVADGAITQAKLATTGARRPFALGTGGACGSGGTTWEPLGQRPSYYRDPLGIVHLSGGAQCPSPNTIQIGTLPPGFRPAFAQHFAAAGIDNSGPIAMSLLIEPGGAVRQENPVEVIYFDGIDFRCGPSGRNGCP
jgi:hypothetical protein